MDDIKIEATKSSPMIHFDIMNKKISIKGRSYPENAFLFYNPIFEYLKQFLQFVKEKIIIDIELSYLNTSSSKAILLFCDIINEAYLEGKEIQINWFYDEENDLALECGNEFKEDLKVPFNIILNK